MSCFTDEVAESQRSYKQLPRSNTARQWQSQKWNLPSDAVLQAFSVGTLPLPCDIM